MQDKGKAKGMKRSQPKRDWTEARAKVENEGKCRFYGHDLGCAGKLEAAHIIGRKHDVPACACGHPPETHDRYGCQHANCHTDGKCKRGARLFVRAKSIVPLCKIHHDRYDGRDNHRIDLLGCLTPEEEAQAVLDAGSLESARRRLAPSCYRQERETDAA